MTSTSSVATLSNGDRKFFFNVAYLKAAGDKLLMNKFIRQKFGGGLTLKKLYILNAG